MGDFIFDNKVLEELKKLTLYSDAIAKDNDIVIMDYPDLIKPIANRNKDYFDMVNDIFATGFNIPLVEEKTKLFTIQNYEKLKSIDGGDFKIVSELDDRYIIEYDNVFSKTYYFDLYREYQDDGKLLLICNNVSFKNKSDVTIHISINDISTPKKLIDLILNWINENPTLRGY